MADKSNTVDNNIVVYRSTCETHSNKIIYCNYHHHHPTSTAVMTSLESTTHITMYKDIQFNTQPSFTQTHTDRSSAVSATETLKSFKTRM